MPRINAAGLAIIKGDEGDVLTAYPDPGSNDGLPWTIGYGHTAGVHQGMTITQAQADDYLNDDLMEVEEGVNNAIARNINLNQFSALVSFAYNVGLDAFESSTLLEEVNIGDFAAAQQQFGRWINGADGPMAGLIKRRAQEAALFGTPC